MGSCISKCKPKKTSKKSQKIGSQKHEECKCQCIIEQNNTSLVQDKLVISQAPISSPLPSKTSSIISQLSPSNSSSSCTNSYYPPTTSSSSSSGSLLSSASSLASSLSSTTVSSKSNRSFSNDYLRSRAKENPKIARPDYVPIKKGANSKQVQARSSLPTKCHISGKKLNGPKQIQPPSPQRVVRPMAQKRPRCSSPSNLTRQKSFRRESEPEIQPDGPTSRSGRYTRPISASPSRRFNGESIAQGRNFTSSMRRENGYVRPPSPRSNNGGSRRYGRPNNLLGRNTEDGIKGLGSKVQELGLGGLVSAAQDMDMLPIEDAENPHISLDCFIFL